MFFPSEYSPVILQGNIKQTTMSNSSNLKQIEVLINLMEKSRDIANGFTTNRSKEDVQKFWKNLETDLNSIGPPIKSVAEWKKVWLDKKKYVRKKMSENLKNKKATGGGPYKEHKFTPMEETIIRICAMGESVEGFPNAATFGLPSSCRKRKLSMEENKKKGKENCSPLSTAIQPAEAEVHESLDEDILMEMFLNSSELEAQQEKHAEQEVEETVDATKKTNTRPTKERQKAMTSQMALETEIEIQRELCNKIDGAVSSMTHHQEAIEGSFKKIYRSIDRLYDQLKTNAKETKRHNIEMEKMRKQELKTKFDFKKRLIEIEEAKLDKL